MRWMSGSSTVLPATGETNVGEGGDKRGEDKEYWLEGKKGQMGIQENY